MMMKKITSINLAGRAYHVEEGAYDALRAWLDEAGRRLAADPDRDEILGDFEAAIATRADATLGEHKSVVTDGEMASIIEQMGVVEPAAEEPGAGEQGDDAAPTTGLFVTADRTGRRLYRLHDGEWIAGVSTGMAAYFGVDVMLVRIAWVIALFLTSGFVILAYVLLIALVPEARNPEELAAARGTGNLSAQDVVERVRQGAPRIERAGSKLLDVLRVFARIVGWLALVASVVVAAVGAFAIWTSLAEHDLSGWRFDAGSPIWALPVFLCCLLYVVLAPLIGLSLALRRAGAEGPSAPRGRGSTVAPVIGTALWVLAVAGVAAIPWSSTHSLRHVANTGYGKLRFGSQVWCVGYESDRPDSKGSCGARDNCRFMSMGQAIREECPGVHPSTSDSLLDTDEPVPPAEPPDAPR